jgi:hypothetical protein
MKIEDLKIGSLYRLKKNDHFHYYSSCGVLESTKTLNKNIIMTLVGFDNIKSYDYCFIFLYDNIKYYRHFQYNSGTYSDIITDKLFEEIV